ncbi:MAG TPA: FtsX-like permease family protein [Solirubrobacteraceae bacterium]|nr:FtsX-like permease family protein [Solirubrobacteraceae bacterium]
MKPRNVLHLYRVRLRARLLQECFAVVGIAAGVALLFASQVATSSLSSSVAQLSRGIVGNATLQLLARDPHGLEAGMLARVRAIPGVRAAAPLLEANTQASGPRGGESVELVGVDSSLSRLEGSLVRHASPSSFAGVEVVALPAPLAHTLGVTKFGEEVTFRLDGRMAAAGLYEQLHASQIGPLTSSPIAVAPLGASQEMSGLTGRASRILVEPAPGREGAVRAALIRLADGAHLNVEPASYDETLFARASAATNQSTQLFALISALVGFLFAFNAMLLTVPQRRRLIADLRRDGYPPASVIAVLLFDAIVLGVLACALGLALGEELSIHLFKSNPGYLSSAFAVGSQRVVSAQSVAVAVGGGMFAAIVAVLSPLREILSRRPPAVTAPGDLTAGDGGGWGLLKLALGGVACLAAATAILLAAPKLAILGMVLLVAALLLLLPLPLVATLALVRALAPRIVSAVPHVAVMELRAGRTRALAISATGAIAVFGSVAIQAAHGDLLHGLENAAHDMNAFTDVWVSPAGSYNLLKTAPFTPSAQAQLQRLPGVRAVRLYRGGLLDWRDRRVWVIAPPRESSPLLPASQIVEGDVGQASARVRAGGWAVLTQAIAEEHHLHIGSPFTLPTPQPTPMRVAALSTNIGWAPGAIVMNASDYARAWGSEDASAYNVLLDPGVSPAQARREIERALGPRTGLAVETAQQHAGRQRTLSRQGLERLTQIATLILIVAVLAMAAAMANMVWQRRPRLAKLKLEGFPVGELWRTILLESVLLVGVGCMSGAAFGLYGQQLLDRALANVIGFPVVYSFGALVALTSLAIVTVASVAIVALPGYLATGVAPAVALQD